MCVEVEGGFMLPDHWAENAHHGSVWAVKVFHCGAAWVGGVGGEGMKFRQGRGEREEETSSAVVILKPVGGSLL